MYIYLVARCHFNSDGPVIGDGNTPVLPGRVDSERGQTTLVLSLTDPTSAYEGRVVAVVDELGGVKQLMTIAQIAKVFGSDEAATGGALRMAIRRLVTAHLRTIDRL